MRENPEQSQAIWVNTCMTFNKKTHPMSRKIDFQGSV